MTFLVFIFLGIQAVFDFLVDFYDFSLLVARGIQLRYR